MADPTLEEDLQTLSNAIDDLDAEWGPNTNPLDADRMALARIAAALKDREHLEEAARMLTQCVGYALDERPVALPGDPDEKQLLAWLERERARKQTTKSPNAGAKGE